MYKTVWNQLMTDRYILANRATKSLTASNLLEISELTKELPLD